MMNKQNATLIFFLIAPFTYYSATYAMRTSILAPQPITQATTIATSGAYALGRNILGPITIAADDVHLDLNNHTIFEGGSNGITINANIKNITLCNGTISPIAGGNGIDIASGSDNIKIKNMYISQCSIGINATSVSNLFIHDSILTNNTNESIKLTTCSECTITKCITSSSTTGVFIDQSNATYLKKCISINNSNHGFYLLTSNQTICSDCHALFTGNGSANDSYGFLTKDGFYNRFDGCTADKTTTTATAAINVAAGFALTGTEANSSIVHCTVNGVDTPTNDNATAYGILLPISFGSLGTPITGDRGADAHAISWSPTSSYLTVAGAPATNGEITLYEFDPTNDTLTLLDEQSHTGGTIHDVSWSQDESLMSAGGTSASNITTRLFQFEPSTQTFTLLDTADHEQDVYGNSMKTNKPFLIAGGVYDPNGQNKGVFRLYEVDSTTQTLILRDTINVGGFGDAVNTIACSPTKPFCVVAGDLPNALEIKLYEIDYTSKTLTLRHELSYGAIAHAAAWTSDDSFVAICGDGGSIKLYEFDSVAKTLTLRDTKTEHTAAARALAWAPDNSYLAMGGNVSGGYELRTYTFDATAKTLTLSENVSFGATVYGLSWAPSGTHLAACGVQTGGVTHKIYPAATSSVNKCVVANNTVHGVRGNINKTSTGIKVLGTKNLMTSNTAYDNDKNYQFISNINSKINFSETDNESYG